MSMSSNADYTRMGAQPVAGRVRAAMSTCASERSELAAAARHASWLADFASKPQTTHIAVPDANGTRRSRGTP
jgi:hypothetical protein